MKVKIKVKIKFYQNVKFEINLCEIHKLYNVNK